MGANIPLPALTVRPPESPDVLQQYTRLQGLKNMGLQQQAEQQQIQQNALDIQRKQRTMADMNAIMDAQKQYAQSGGTDPGGWIQSLRGKVMPETYMGLVQGDAKTREMLATADKTTREALQAKNDQFVNLLEQAKALPEDQYTKQWPSIIDRAEQIHPGVSQQYGLNPQQPIPQNELSRFEVGLQNADSYFKWADEYAKAQKRPLELQEQQSKTTTAAADAEQKQRANAASQLASATSQQQYSELWGELPAKVARMFPSPEQWTPDAKDAILQGGMTPHEQSSVPLENREASLWVRNHPGSNLNDYQVWKARQAPLARVQVETGAAGAGGPTATETAATTDPNSQSLLSQTGLSLNAFRVLTGQTSQLPRDRFTRNKASQEAQAWANKNGVDVSTLASQYKTYNDVLSSNIDRLNRTKIMEDELSGTIDNLKQTVNEKELGKVNMANVLKVWSGQQVNDQVAQRYAMHLYQLRNELSAYGAATQGRSGNNITLADMNEADQVIKNGISTGSLNGLKKAVEDSTEKMGNVMQRSVDNARKSVWNLFGVGDHYQPTAKQKTQNQSESGGGNPLDQFWKH